MHRTLERGLVLSLVAGLGAPEASAIEIHAVDAGKSLYTVGTEGFGITLIGAMAVPASPFSIQALAFDSAGTLYGLLLGPEATLYRIDPSNAAVTAVGDLGTDYRLEGAVAFDPLAGVMYAVNETSIGQSRLVTLDLATAQSSAIGRIGGGVHDFAGLAFDAAGNLYGLDANTNALWLIDRRDPNGPGTLQIGAGLGSGIVMGSGGGMTYDAATGTYYGYARGSRHLFTVDLQTGLGAVLHAFGPGDPEFLGLAFAGEVPTPARAASWGWIKARYPGPGGSAPLTPVRARSTP